MPGTITRIPYGLFFNCQNLAKFVISPSVIAIEREAFSRCSALESVIIPENVKTLSASAFEYCDNATVILLGHETEINDDSANKTSKYNPQYYATGETYASLLNAFNTEIVKKFLGGFSV